MSSSDLFHFPLGRGRAAVTALAVAVTMAGAAAAGAAEPTLQSLYKAAKDAGESTVVLYGPPSAKLRGEFQRLWSKRFPDIELQYSGMSGNKAAAKLKSEAQAGVHAADVIVSGTTTGTRLLKPSALVRPFDDLIVLPEVRDGKNWIDGELAWADDDKTVLAMLAIVTPAAAVNTDLVKPGEVEGDMDLLNPKWKGKIVSNDPRVPGSADLVYRRLYDLHGEDYLRKLVVDQEVVFTRDLRTAVDKAVKGEYAIVIGASPSILNAFITKGITNLGVDQNKRWKGGPRGDSAGFGGLAVPKQPPHPHAAKLFVNWILTKEGQTGLSRGLEYPDRRVDVDLDEVPSYLMQQKGIKYYHSFTESYLTHPNHNKMRAFMRETITN